MKTTTPLLAFLLFLLFAFTTTGEIVLDSDGDPMRNGGTYLLSPPDRIGGRVIIGTSIWKGDSDACSLAVVHAPYTHGWPVTVTARVRPTYIHTSYQLHLSFAEPNNCTNPSNWLVVASVPVGLPVMVGDAQDLVVSGWFYIKPYDSANKLYKLVFCHDRELGECGNIGVHIDSKDLRRLVVTDGEPLKFKFDKVPESSFASQSDLSMVV